MTRYWRGKAGTTKEGFCGTMADDGIVPDTIDITQSEYDAYIASLPPPIIKAIYQRVMDDLDLIINTSSPTNAQVIWAVKRLAEIEKKELQYHRLQFTFE